ncbi:hypothetical protein AAMO2058_001233500 [Amorphochlora amoebiformis]
MLGLAFGFLLAAEGTFLTSLGTIPENYFAALSGYSLSKYGPEKAKSASLGLAEIQIAPVAQFAANNFELLDSNGFANGTLDNQELGRFLSTYIVRMMVKKLDIAGGPNGGKDGELSLFELVTGIGESFSSMKTGNHYLLADTSGKENGKYDGVDKDELKEWLQTPIQLSHHHSQRKGSHSSIVSKKSHAHVAQTNAKTINEIYECYSLYGSGIDADEMDAMYAAIAAVKWFKLLDYSRTEENEQMKYASDKSLSGAELTKVFNDGLTEQMKRLDTEYDPALRIGDLEVEELAGGRAAKGKISATPMMLWEHLQVIKHLAFNFKKAMEFDSTASGGDADGELDKDEVLKYFGLQTI